MLFVPAGIRLVIPLSRAAARRTVKPQCIGCGVLALAVDYSAGKPDILVSCFLIKVPLDGCLKASRTLENHLLQIADRFEVQAIRFDPVDAYIADHQHAKLTLAFCFGSHESG